MKQRHHRKRVQRAMWSDRYKRLPARLRSIFGAIPRWQFASYGRRVGKTWLQQQLTGLPARDNMDLGDHARDAFAYCVQAMQTLKPDLLPSDFDVAMAVDNRTANEINLQREEAEKRLRNLIIFGNTHPEFYLEEWQPRERTKLELAAMEIAQQAELFDRTLPHYVREGSFEAIPADAGALRLSGCNFQELITAAAERLGVDRGEVVRAERDYSRSSEFAQWLRENPPGRPV